MMAIFNNYFIYDFRKIILILSLIFCLSNNIYSIEYQESDSLLIQYKQSNDSLVIDNQILRDEIQRTTNEMAILKDRWTDMEYFTRLLQFAAGLLVILCIAEFILLLIYVKKKQIKKSTHRATGATSGQRDPS